MHVLYPSYYLYHEFKYVATYFKTNSTYNRKVRVLNPAILLCLIHFDSILLKLMIWARSSLWSKPLYWFKSNTQIQIGWYFRPILKPIIETEFQRKNVVTDSKGYFFQNNRAPKTKFDAKWF